MIHRIELDSVRKYRNANEWRPVGRARCGEIESIGDGSNIRACVAKMLDLGMSGDVEVVRGQTTVFAAISMSEWLRGAPWSKGQPEHLKRGAV